nr:MAG TPA: hypothetical protein [Caudoviricetes sp.]
MYLLVIPVTTSPILKRKPLRHLVTLKAVAKPNKVVVPVVVEAVVHKKVVHPLAHLLRVAAPSNNPSLWFH